MKSNVASSNRKRYFIIYMKLLLPQKILILRLSSIGDILLASPLLRVLRKAVGTKARLDFVVKKEYAELVQFSHHISLVHEYDSATGFSGLRELKRTLHHEQYDLIVDIHDSVRTKYLRAFRKIPSVVIDKRKYERWQLVKLKRNVYKEIIPIAGRYIEPLKEYGIENDEKGLEIFIPDEIQFSISGKMAKLKLHQYNRVVGICPGAKHFTKRWQIEKFAEAGSSLAKEHNVKIFIFGGKEDSQICTTIAHLISEKTSPLHVTNFAGEFSLLETAAAMEFCDVVLTNDTGLMHLAAAKQKRIVALFGSTVKEFGFAPYGTEATVIENSALTCRPCSHIGKKECPEKHFDCMKNISVDEVVSAVKNYLVK